MADIALHIPLRNLSAILRNALAEAQHERDMRPDVVEVGGERELEWVFHERDVMHRAVNRFRTGVGLPEVPIEAVIRSERSACGHVDYTAKYAFYCAEIALGCSPIWKTEESTV